MFSMRQTGRGVLLCAALALAPALAGAQTLIASGAVGASPRAVAVNPINNKTYIAQHGAGTVRVMDGSAGAITNVDVSAYGAPNALAIDPASGRVMVGTDGGFAIIDGASNAVVTGTPLSATASVSAVAVNAATHLFYMVDAGTVFNATTDTRSVWVYDTNGSGSHVEVRCPGAVAINPRTNNAYVTNACDGTVTVIASGNVTHTIATAANPRLVAVDPTMNRIYVAHDGTTGVAVVDGAAEMTTLLATGFSSPTAMAVNPAIGRVLVANAGTRDLAVITEATNAVNNIGFAIDPTAIVADTAHGRFYFTADQSLFVAIFDGATLGIGTNFTLPLGIAASALAVNPLTSRVFALDQAASRLAVADDRIYMQGVLPIFGAVAASADPVNRLAYIAVGGNPGMLHMVDETDNSIVASVAVGADPNHLAVDPVLGFVYTSNTSAGTVSVVGIFGRQLVATVNVESAPGAIAVNPVTHKVYVAQPTTGHVRVIDGHGIAFVPATLNVTGQPIGFAVDPVADRIYVANGARNTGIPNPVIDGATNSVTGLGGPVPAFGATDIAVNPATGRVYIARNSASVVQEFDGVSGTPLHDYAVSFPRAIALDTVSNRIYVAAIEAALHVIDGASGTMTLINIGDYTNFIVVDEIADRLFLSKTGGAAVVDGASATVTPSWSEIFETFSGRAAVDPAMGKAYFPVPSGEVITITEYNPAAVGNEALFAGTSSGSLTGLPDPTLTVTPCCAYPGGGPGMSLNVDAVHFAVDDLYASHAAAVAGSGTFAAQLTGVTPGLHYVSLFATDAMTTGTVDGSSSGSFLIGPPKVFPLLMLGPPIFRPNTLPRGKPGVPYLGQVLAVGGVFPMSFTTTGGALPDGLALGSDGTIQGTPTTEGVFNFTITARDFSGATASQLASIAIFAQDPALSTPAGFGWGDVPVGFPGIPSGFQLTNGGAVDLVISSITVSGANAAEFGANSSCGTLAPGATCVVSMTFTPASLGLRDAVLTIASDDPVAPTTTISLSGNGVPVYATPDPFTFVDATGVVPGSAQVSNVVAAHGVNVPVPISVTGGEYSLGCSGVFVSTPGIIQPDGLVCVRNTASSSFGGGVQTTLTMGGVSATFTTTTQQGSGLLVQPFGPGAISGPGIACPGTCSVIDAIGTTVLLVATPASGSMAQWIGCDTVDGDQCTVTLGSGGRTVSVNFVSFVTLSITTSGNGAGTVTAQTTSGTFSCSSACTWRLTPLTEVILSVAPAAGSAFSGWSGGQCLGTGGCLLVMSSAESDVADFSTGTAIPRLANISTRGQVLTGDEVMIGGFVIGGSAPKTVAITATGPSLAPFGISDYLANPTLTLVRSSDQAIIATNDDWQTDANHAQLLASGFAPADSREAGLYVTLPPGAYTAIVQGAGGGTGVSVVGVFEVGHPEIPLVNISTRGVVRSGEDVMIGGFIVNGDMPKKVIITATGPSLASFGINNFLANPKLTIVRSSDQAIVATNDDWEADVNASQLSGTPFEPQNLLEAGLVLTLPPGAYTAVVSGSGGTTGISVIGVFTVP
jgi:DNA-binding beta-propeller fold protein YncE